MPVLDLDEANVGAAAGELSRARDVDDVVVRPVDDERRYADLGQPDVEVRKLRDEAEIDPGLRVRGVVVDLQ